MLSGASAITVPTASQKRRYSPKVCASRQRTSTTGSRNCSAWSNALTAPNENARRASPCAAIDFATALIFPGAAFCRGAKRSCELVEEPRIARQHFGGGMIALEMREAIVARLSPESTVGQERLHARGALADVLEDRVDRGADVDRRDGRHATRPGLQEHVRHAFVHRGENQEPRLVEPALDRRERQEPREFHVGQRGGARAKLFEVAGFQPLAADARAADHDEAAPGQTLGDVEEEMRPLVIVDRPDPQHAVTLERGARGVLGRHVAARDDLRLAPVVAAAALELEGILGDDAVDARGARPGGPLVRGVQDLLLADLEVAVGSAGVDRALAVAAAELRHHAGPHGARAL